MIIGRTQTVVKTITTGQDTFGVAVSSQTGMVYVADVDENTVSVIDGATDRVVGTAAVGQSLDALAISPQTHAVYVTNINDNTVSEFG